MNATHGWTDKKSKPVNDGLAGMYKTV